MIKNAFVSTAPATIAELVADCLAGKHEFSDAVYAEIKSYLTAMGIPISLYEQTG